MDRLDPATERYLRKALKAAYEKGRTRGRSETISGMFAGLNGDGERVLTKALAGLIRKAWSEDDHPRGDDGRFISGEDLSAAKTDPAKAKELRARVTDPGERRKLEAAIGTEAKDAAPAAGPEKDAQAAGPAGEPPQELESAAADAGVDHFPSWAEASFGLGAEARRLGVDPARAATDRRTAGLAAAVHRYRAGDNYHVARKLRAGEELAPDEREAFEAVQGLASRSELPLDARLFRRVGEGFPAAAVGDVLRDAAPSFVAFRESHARNVRVPGDQRLLVIDAPKGSNALYVNAGEGPEGILPAGARLRVTAVEGDRIHARYEPAGVSDRPRVAAGLTPEQVAAHVEAADLDPTRFTPDDLYTLAKQAPAETGARRRMLAELANHEDSVGKKLAAGGEVHPDVLAHYPHLSNPAGGSQPAGIEPAPGKDTSPAAPTAPAASDSTPEVQTQADPTPDTTSAGSGSKPKVEYVRAPAGGKQSDVDGKFYRGGQLMPVHGLYSGQERRPKGQGVSTADPVKPNEDAEGGPRRQPARPLSPEEIEAKRLEAEHQKKWDEVNAGPLGRMKWLGERPNGKALGNSVTDLNSWKQFAESLGEEKLSAVATVLQARHEGRLDADEAAKVAAGKPPTSADGMEWAKNEPRRQAESDASMFHGSKGHLKKLPSSYHARQGVQSALDGGGVDGFHEVNAILADAERLTAAEFATKYGAPAPADAPAAKPKRAKKPAAKKPAGVESAPPAGDTAGVGTPAGESELANAVARDAHARKYSSRVGDPSLAAADLTPEQYAALPTVYRGGAPRAGGHVYVTNDPDLAAAHGPVTAYKLAPGATVYPDPEVDEELRDRGTNRHGHAALFGLRQGSAVVHTSHLLPADAPAAKPKRAKKPAAGSGGAVIPTGSSATPEVAAPASGVAGVTVSDPETVGAHSGQTNHAVTARDAAGRPVGKLEYSLYGGQIHVAHVEVAESHRRRGIATALYESALSAHPDAKLAPAMRTPEGTAFRAALDAKHPGRVAADEDTTPPTEHAPEEWSRANAAEREAREKFGRGSAQHRAAEELVERMNDYDNAVLAWQPGRAKPVKPSLPT